MDQKELVTRLINQEYEALKTDDMYKLSPFCIGLDNDEKSCEFCKPERLHDDRWVLRCDKKYHSWNNLICPATGTKTALKY